MSLSARTAAAALLSSLGTMAVYVGVFLNMAALGSTLGYLPIFLGILLLAAATLPLRAIPKASAQYVGVAVLRYLSLPIFVLGAVTLIATIPSMLAAKGQVYGFGIASVLTITGLFAVLWPETMMLWHRMKRADA